MTTYADNYSPNKHIDEALEKLMKNVKKEPADVAVKIINSAIQWEKVKHMIEDKDEGFDPDGDVK